MWIAYSIFHSWRWYQERRLHQQLAQIPCLLFLKGWQEWRKRSAISRWGPSSTLRSRMKCNQRGHESSHRWIYEVFDRFGIDNQQLWISILGNHSWRGNCYNWICLGFSQFYANSRCLKIEISYWLSPVSSVNIWSILNVQVV